MYVGFSFLETMLMLPSVFVSFYIAATIAHPADDVRSRRYRMCLYFRKKGNPKNKYYVPVGHLTAARCPHQMYQVGIVMPFYRFACSSSIINHSCHSSNAAPILSI